MSDRLSTSAHVRENISLQPFNTFRVAAHARYFTELTEASQLSELYENGWFSGAMPVLVLGGGSNVLFLADFPGLVLLNRLEGIQVEEQRDGQVVLSAGAGEDWHSFVRTTIEMGYQGLENLTLIPGTVGAAPVQNIGAYGVEISDRLQYVEAFDLHTGQTVRFSAADCRFSYRDSLFKQEGRGRYLILRVGFLLNLEPELNLSYGAIGETLSQMGIFNPTPADVSLAVESIRRSKLPDPAQVGNCGSFFKNPEVDMAVYEAIAAQYPNGIPHFMLPEGRVKIPAGWLIEQCGWKGKRIGAVGTWPRQALVIVSYAGATGAEIGAFAANIRQSVEERFGICLSEEVNFY